MNNARTGIVPTARPVAAPAPSASVAPAGAPKVYAPAEFDPQKFFDAMSTNAPQWGQLPIQDKLVRVMAYLPNVTNSQAIAGAIAATDAYAYQIMSPKGPMQNGVPVGKAAPSMVSPMQPASTIGVDPLGGLVTDVPQQPMTPPRVAIPKPLVVFDSKLGKMVVPGPKPAGQASTPINWTGWLAAAVAVGALGFLVLQVMEDRASEDAREKARRAWDEEYRRRGGHW